MIFVLERTGRDRIEVERFADLESVTQSLEWQDVRYGAYVIVADDGAEYACTSDAPTVYEYEVHATGRRPDVTARCRAEFEQRRWPGDIEIRDPEFRPFPESRSDPDGQWERTGAGRDQAIDAWCASVWSAFHEHHRAVTELVKQHGIS